MNRFDRTPRRVLTCGRPIVRGPALTLTVLLMIGATTGFAMDSATLGKKDPSANAVLNPLETKPVWVSDTATSMPASLLIEMMESQRAMMVATRVEVSKRPAPRSPYMPAMMVGAYELPPWKP